MEYKDLENIANKEKITISSYKMNKCKARIIKYEGYHIFMDYSKIHTYTEEKCCLAEELGHYYYDAFYTLSSSKNEIQRQEYKSMKWKSLACVPLNSILRCFKEGIINLYDVADNLQVEPNMVRFAYQYYIDNEKLYTNEEMLGYSI